MIAPKERTGNTRNLTKDRKRTMIWDRRIQGRRIRAEKKKEVLQKRIVKLSSLQLTESGNEPVIKRT